MKLLELKVKGFRSLADVTWTPGDLNVVIGANGSGKSNLLKALEFLASCATGELPKLIIREGGSAAIRWDGTAESVELLVNNGDPRWAYWVVLEPTGSYLTIETETLAVTFDESDSVPFIFDRDRTTFVARNADDSSSVTKPLSELQVSGDATMLSLLNKPLSDTKITAVGQALGSWRVYRVLRTDANSSVRQYATPARYEKTLDADGDNLISVLHTLYLDKERRAFQNDLDAAMSAAFGDEYETVTFPPAADKVIQMCVRWKSLKRAQNASDLSDGTLRFLYLIAILANPEPPALIAIEHPEEGLHPGMLPIVAEFAETASKRTQVIFTTHSADFLDCFRKVIPTVTIAECTEGKTQLRVLDSDHLAYWLKEYSLGKMYRNGLEQVS